jgi:hypothetical protein
VLTTVLVVVFSISLAYVTTSEYVRQLGFDLIGTWFSASLVV